jgi:phosphoglycerate dehydrogenase-like enzyme
MRILFCHDSFPEHRRRLLPLIPYHEFVVCAPGEVAGHIDGTDIVIPITTQIGAELIACGTFGLIQQFGVGLESVDIAAATDAGVWVARVPSEGTGNAESVAEHALLLMLALSRSLFAARESFAARRFGDPFGRALLGKTACIIGLGGIGIELAKRLRPFGMRVTAVREHPERGAPTDTGIECVYGADAMHESIQDADYVILCINYDPARHKNLVNAEFLAAMKPTAYLVNIARGGLVDPDALQAALSQRRLAGAGLDVFWEEPVDPDHLLFRENVIVTPHIAGVTDASCQGIAEGVARNIARYVENLPPLNAVNAPEHPRRSIRVL